MMDRDQLHRLIDQIPEHKLHAVVTLLEALNILPIPGRDAVGRPPFAEDARLTTQEVAADKMDKDLGV